MAIKQRSLSICLVLVLFLGAFSSPVAASELSDAEKTHSELRDAYQRYIETLNGFTAKEAEAQDCISKLADSTNAADVTRRNECQQSLSKIQDERSTLVASEQNSKSKILELEQLIQRLREAAATSGTNSGGSASSSQSGITPLIPEVVEKKPEATQAGGSEAKPVSGEQAQPSVAAPTPLQSPTAVAQPSAAATPSVAPGSKASAAAKPVVKKRTITCVKGKVTRKVTAVKPVCPKGFKIRKK